MFSLFIDPVYAHQQLYKAQPAMFKHIHNHTDTHTHTSSQFASIYRECFNQNRTH